MPQSEWTTVRQMVETFTCERPVKRPERAQEVLLCVLRHVHDRAALLAGEWIFHAPVEVHAHLDAPGYGAARTLALLDRFFRWLHDREDLTRWQLDVLRTLVDDSRSAHGRPRRQDKRTEECVMSSLNQARLIEGFVATLEEHQRPFARIVVQMLECHFRAQLGGASRMPLGSLDVDDMLSLCVSAERDGEGDGTEETRAELTVTAAFYRWLGEQGHLEPSRARAIASQLASAALGLGAR